MPALSLPQAPRIQSRFVWPFRARSKAAEAPAKEAWPTELNPCPKYGERSADGKFRHSGAPNWDCYGRVTKICLTCVYECTAEFSGHFCNAQHAALMTFNPDPDGAICDESPPLMAESIARCKCDFYTHPRRAHRPKAA